MCLCLDSWVVPTSPMQTCSQNQQVWPCAAPKYFASLGCAVRWSGFNCPWDTLTFTWLKVTLCRVGPVGGDITLGRRWKALPVSICQGQECMCSCASPHTCVIRACVSMLCKYDITYAAAFQSCTLSKEFTFSLMFGNFRDDSIRGMGWDLLLSLWKRQSVSVRV